MNSRFYRVCIVCFFCFPMFFHGTLFARDELLLAESLVVAPHQPREFGFPVADAESRQIRLSLDVRFDWRTLGGYTNGMFITVNGQRITGKRLLNKRLRCGLRNGTVLNWASEEGSSFTIMYAGNFSDEILTNRHYIYGIVEENQDPFRFVFDLSGLTVHNIENKIVVSPIHSVGLVLANVKVEFDREVMPRINDSAAQVSPAPEGELPDFTLKKAHPVKATLKAMNDGIITLEFDKKRYSLRSRFSLPDGKWCGSGMKSGSWSKDGQDTVLLQTPDWQLTRKVELHPGYVKIADKFENLSDAVVGIIFENDLSLPETPRKILRCGRVSDLRDMYSGSNPSVVAEMSRGVVGMVAEDDIFRNQHYLQKDEKTLRLGNRRFGLPPRGTHTLEWSIFFIGEGDYYDFVNAVRRAWESNFTMHGTLAFPRGGTVTDWNASNVTPGFIRRYLQNNPVRMVMTHVPTSPRVPRARSTIEDPWIGHGTAALQFDWWLGRTAKLIQTLREVDPEVEVYVYMHKNLCSEPGYPEKYRDSVALDASGNERRAGKLGLFQPTVNNSYGKALAEVYRYFVDSLDANIYMDEICLSVTTAAPYEEWDNCTVEINPANHRVIRKLSLPNLLAKPWLEEMISYLKKNGKKLLANGPPVTRTLQQHRLQHFVEAGAGESGLIAAHLATPLGWQGYEVGFPAYRYFKECLNHGTLTITWSGVWNDHLFPFTPLELRPGYLIGEERIVTRLSGRFGWGDRSDVEVKMYDGQGKPVCSPDVAAMETVSGRVFEVRMPSDHVAVLIRKP